MITIKKDDKVLKVSAETYKTMFKSIGYEIVEEEVQKSTSSKNKNKNSTTTKNKKETKNKIVEDEEENIEDVLNIVNKEEADIQGE